MEVHQVATFMRGTAGWLEGLRELIADLPGTGMTMAEIGCFAGESTGLFAESGKFQKIFAIDPWVSAYDPGDIRAEGEQECIDEAERLFDAMCARNHGIVRKIRQKSAEAAPSFVDASLDFLYVDGHHSHESVRNDITMFLPKMRPHAVLAGHDWGVWPGVAKAFVEMFKREPDKLYSDTSWLVRL